MSRALFVLAGLIAATSASAQVTEYRPLPPTIGIGLGVTVPSSPLGINTASARLRVADAMTLEPTLGFRLVRGGTTTEVGTESTETRTTDQEIFVGTNLRYHFNMAGRADAVALVGAGVDLDTTTLDPEGASNDTITRSTTFQTHWGLGVEYFVNENWSVSADAMNPLLALGTTSVDDEGSTTETTSTSLTVAAMWRPTVRMMAHLYF